jgi:DNA-binding transcriptional ArsR family regulator
MSDSVLPSGFFAQARVFAALGDETRLSLVMRLFEQGRQSITRLAQGGSITRQAVTKHLATLEGAGLVRALRQGRETLYEFDATPISTMQEYLDRVSGQWEKKLGDLKDYLGE